MDGAYSSDVDVNTTLVRQLEERDPLIDTGVDGRLVLKWIVGKYSWTVLM